MDQDARIFCSILCNRCSDHTSLTCCMSSVLLGCVCRRRRVTFQIWGVLICWHNSLCMHCFISLSYCIEIVSVCVWRRTPLMPLCVLHITGLMTYIPVIYSNMLIECCVCIIVVYRIALHQKIASKSIIHWSFQGLTTPKVWLSLWHLRRQICHKEVSQ